MAGITDLPYRMTVRPFGCSLAFTEMVSTNSLAYKSKNTFKAFYQKKIIWILDMLGRAYS
jgi:tRNA-dihydrouridine synthase